MTTSLKDWRAREKKAAEAVASELGVTPAMWSRWENGHRQIPAERVLEVERVTGISRHDLRPDVFGPAEDRAA
jgi:DNA-binding transcriptional regulator YdaS (Cro superfamily)